MVELTYDTRSTPLAATGTYRPLRYRIGPPATERVRWTAARVLASYYGCNLSFTRWRSAGWLVFGWSNSKSVKQITLPFRFEAICEHLKERRSFDVTAFNFPVLISGWLDASTVITPKFHAPANEDPAEALTFQVPTAISEAFPIRPQLDREGVAFSSLQLMLLRSWLELRDATVDHSERMFEDRNDWLRDLFGYFSTITAAVDNTLHQLYYRAKYESDQHGWRFNERALGATHGRRMRDKLKWIGQITGQPLRCTRAIQRFHQLRQVRNHLAHFDPPALAFTIEDVAEWLNASADVAELLAEIRAHLKEPLCVPLVELLLAREVEWYPWDPGKRRVPQRPDVGYSSSVTPRSVP